MPFDTQPVAALSESESRLFSATLPSPLLVVEAATSAGSAALVIDGRIVGRSDVAMGVTRDDTLFPAVQSLLADASLGARKLRAIVCGAGPGSFTSLRIAGALAKGLTFAGECALYSVSSLMLAAATLPRAGRYIVHADALRGERFVLDVEIGVDGLARAQSAVRRVPFAELVALGEGRERLAVRSSPEPELEAYVVTPDAASIIRCVDWFADGPVSLDQWEPDYGRLAEAQVKWEAAQGRALADG